jgi:D-alanyl-D-alanine carboxypeptidase/D-alanyl-D-alanine-endopeptidase (penicillin-binding protein 4)
MRYNHWTINFSMNLAMMRAVRTRIVILHVGLLALLSAGSAGELTTEIGKALEDPRLEGATVGIHVIDVDSGQVLYSRGASRPMIPASNQKIITAVTALAELGPRFKFRTGLWMRGTVDEAGVLEGELLLQGGGDPTLGRDLSAHQEDGAAEARMSTLQRWADQLAADGLRRVAGDLIVDDRFFDRQHVHPDWPRAQIWREYCAPSAGLVYGESCVTVSVKPGKNVGEPAQVSLMPAVEGLTVANSCITKPERHVIWFDREPGSSVIRVGGYVRHESVGYTGRVTVPEPALFAGRAFRQVLGECGVRIGGSVRLARGDRPDESHDWRRVEERLVPLTDVLSVMLRESQNLYAEQVVKTIGAVRSQEGSWEAGLARMGDVLTGLDATEEGFHLADGSGMSRRNRLTPRLVCRVLSALASLNGRDFSGLLAAPGEGTLRRRFREKPYHQNVRAKTGFLRGVGALSGYVRTTGGRRVIFSILINDFSRGSNPDMKQIEDAAVRAIVDHAG